MIMCLVGPHRRFVSRVALLQTDSAGEYGRARQLFHTIFLALHLIYAHLELVGLTLLQ